MYVSCLGNKQRRARLRDKSVSACGRKAGRIVEACVQEDKRFPE